MKNALAIICVQPHDFLCKFYNSIVDYDVFMIIDDESNHYSEMREKYTNITFLQIPSNDCSQRNIRNCTTTAVIRKEVSGWDKALYCFMHVYTDYQYVWFLEDDVFFHDTNTLIAIDSRYDNYDLLCNTNYEEGKSNEWLWSSIDIGFPSPYYCGMVCASRMSRNMLICLQEYANRNKTLFFHEAMFPSIAKYFRLNTIEAPKELQTITYNRAWDFPKDFNSHQLYHPIKNPEHHLMIRDHIRKQVPTTITFATCWYNLRAKYSPDIYEKWMKNILEHVENFNLVVFTNEDSKELVEKYLVKKSNVKMVVCECEDFHGYQWEYYWKINHEKNDYLNHRSEHNTQWQLNMLWNEKMHFVRRTITIYDTDYYGWMDIGYFRDYPIPTSWPHCNHLYHDKIYYAKVCDDNELSELSNFVNNRNEYNLPIQPIPPMQMSIAGGCFVCNKAKLKW